MSLICCCSCPGSRKSDASAGTVPVAADKMAESAPTPTLLRRVVEISTSDLPAFIGKGGSKIREVQAFLLTKHGAHLRVPPRDSKERVSPLPFMRNRSSKWMVHTSELIVYAPSIDALASACTYVNGIVGEIIYAQQERQERQEEYEERQSARDERQAAYAQRKKEWEAGAEERKAEQARKRLEAKERQAAWEKDRAAWKAGAKDRADMYAERDMYRREREREEWAASAWTRTGTAAEIHEKQSCIDRVDARDVSLAGL